MITKPAAAPPKCRKCGSPKIRATSSQQMRRLNGKQRLVADAVCQSCGWSWWSHHKAILKLAREVDARRTARNTPDGEEV